MAYIAYHFHWPQPHLMGMEHFERQRWVGRIAEMNRRQGEQP